jgi:hypothetical protein
MNIYASSAALYKPEKIKVLIVAESPPASNTTGDTRYFYFPGNTKWDYLFTAIIQVVFPDEVIVISSPADKEKLLLKFRDAGFFLIDACEYPINKMSNGQKRKEILANYPNLKERLKDFVDKQTKIILIKKNVFELLAKRLSDDGFAVINKSFINFPSHGNQRIFKEKFSSVIKELL